MDAVSYRDTALVDLLDAFASTDAVLIDGPATNLVRANTSAILTVFKKGEAAAGAPA